MPTRHHAVVENVSAVLAVRHAPRNTRDGGTDAHVPAGFDQLRRRGVGVVLHRGEQALPHGGHLLLEPRGASALWWVPRELARRVVIFEAFVQAYGSASQPRGLSA